MPRSNLFTRDLFIIRMNQQKKDEQYARERKKRGNMKERGEQIKGRRKKHDRERKREYKHLSSLSGWS